MTTPSLPTVYLLHGYPDDGHIWEPVQALLTEAGLESRAPTYAWQAGTNLTDFADDIIRDIEESSPESVLVVGHSMGAPVAELVARRLGDDRVAGLVLLTPIPLGGLPLPAEVAGPLRECGESAETQKALRAQLALDMAPDVLDTLTDRGSRLPADRVAQVFDAWTAGDAAAAELSPPAVPTRVVTTEDSFVNDAVVDLIRARHRDAEYSTVLGVGHWPHAENPAAISALIVEFAESVRSQGSDAGEVSGAAWTGAFRARSADVFADGFAEDVRLEAAALVHPVVGREQVAAVMQAASSSYEHLVFTAQADSGSSRFLSWEARTFSGLEFRGVTILEHDESGRITQAAIHHRPLGNVVAFSRELGEKLQGRVSRDHFWQGE